VLKVVVLASGTGSLTKALIDAEKADVLQAHLVAVGADREADVLGIAAAAGLPTFLVVPADFASRDDWNAALAQAVEASKPDLVVSAGFMRILGAPYLERLGRITINTHPAMLPAFPGAHAVRDALAAGVSQTGCTVHRVTADMDAGPILAQTLVPVLPGDTEETLHERIKKVERLQLVAVINQIAAGAISLT